MTRPKRLTPADYNGNPLAAARFAKGFTLLGIAREIMRVFHEHEASHNKCEAIRVSVGVGETGKYCANEETVRKIAIVCGIDDKKLFSDYRAWYTLRRMATRGWMQGRKPPTKRVRLQAAMYDDGEDEALIVVGVTE